MNTKQETAWQAVLAEMKRRVKARPRGELSRIAEDLGVSRATVSRWLSGDLKGKRMPYDAVVRLLQGLDLDPAEYFPTPADDGGYFQIPWLAASASMGPGSLEAGREIVSHLSFRADWLLGKGTPSRMVVISAGGGSMEPTIPDGSVVLIDESRVTDLVNGRVYFVCRGEELFLKRLKVGPDGKVLALISDRDNSEAPLTPGEHFQVLGRAVWYGKDL